jgi:integrase
MAKVALLSARTVQTLRKPGMYLDGRGLYLRIGPGGNKSWIYRFALGGKTRDMGLGPYPDIPLAEARERAAAQRKLRLDGTDPIAARQAGKHQARLDAVKVMTFKACADAYIGAHQAGWKNPKHAAQWPATLGAYAYPIFGSLPVQAVDVGLVMKAIEPIWTEKPETASRVRGRIESVLDWATARGYRNGENPARWRGHLENLLPKRSKVRRVQHHAALPYAEIGGFMAELRKQEGIGARALQFAILTAGRTGEIIGARWSEISLADRLWTIPAERMKKADKEHRVPLSAPAVAILNQMAAIRSGEFVFPGAKPGRPLSNMSMLMLLRRMGRDDLTAHGFRSCFRDWAAECTNFPGEVAEMALAHAVSDKVEAAYRRGDLFQKRQALAEAWASYCAGVPEGNVVLLSSAAGA